MSVIWGEKNFLFFYFFWSYISILGNKISYTISKKKKKKKRIGHLISTYIGIIYLWDLAATLVLQFVLGFLAYCFPGAEWTARATLLPWHIFVGMVIFFFAMVNAEIGLSGLSQTVISFSERYIVNFTGLLILLYAISVALVVILPGRY